MKLTRKDKIRYVLFERYWQRRNIGSSRIRGYWVIEALKKLGYDANILRQGEDCSVLIFQKAYWKEMARAFKGIKILDICDPDWLDGVEMANFCKEMDAVITSTIQLKKEMQGFCKCPVYFIPDRVKLENLPKPKIHKGGAKDCCWFGYSHNMEVLEAIPLKLKKLGLSLTVISDGQYKDGVIAVKNIKWQAETVDRNIQKSDIVVMPLSKIGRNVYKSNNKIVHSWALGMPVATNPQELERFLDSNERNKEAAKRLKEIKEKYDVRLSAEELLNLINVITKNKSK